MSEFPYVARVITTCKYTSPSGGFYDMHIFFPNSGLIGDSPIEFHGVGVRKVKRVELIDPRSVSILLNVRKNAPVTRATVATLTARARYQKVHRLPLRCPR